jgi:hypothetical protein
MRFYEANTSPRYAIMRRQAIFTWHQAKTTIILTFIDERAARTFDRTTASAWAVGFSTSHASRTRSIRPAEVARGPLAGAGSHRGKPFRLQEPVQLGVQHCGRLLARVPILLRAQRGNHQARGRIFHEPINIRAENVARIEAHAAEMGVRLRTDVFATRESWQNYAVNALHTVFELARELGIEQHLHLWPDKSLGSQALAARMPNPAKYLKRLDHWWRRVSEWPK